jgi:serine/threonine protein phosphatase PrpC
MELNKYLKGINIPAIDEEQVKIFLSQKELEIQSYIENAWSVFASNHEVVKANQSISELPVQESRLKDQDLQVAKPIVNENELLTEVTTPLTEIPAEKVLEVKDIPVVVTDCTANLPEVADVGIVNNQVYLNEIVKNPPETKNIIPTDEIKANEAFEQKIKNKNLIIPNGKVNQEYCYRLTADAMGLDNIKYYWFEGLVDTGLEYNSETHEIKGIPKTAGELKITLKVKRDDWIEGKPIFERSLTLFINHDPKSLWNNIPTPIDIEYYKPDKDKKFVKVEDTMGGIIGISKIINKSMIAASQRGRSHSHEGKARDDDFGLYHLKNSEWYIMVVADGAGSAKSSRKGSEIACKTVIEVCKEELNKRHKDFEQHLKVFNTDPSESNRKKVGDDLYHIIGTSVFNAMRNIEVEAKLKENPTKEYATTLIVSISKKFKFGWFVGAFWVGDGGIGIFNQETQYLKLLGETDGGEYAGQTRFLTMPEITQPKELYRRLRFEIVEDFTALILMTDGVTDPKFETDANLSKFEKWNDLWNDISTEVVFNSSNSKVDDQLLAWLDFWSQGNHDDRTIAILF